MTLLTSALLLSFLAEFIAIITTHKFYRYILACISLLLITVPATVILTIEFNVVGVILVSISTVRLINVFRLVKARMHRNELREKSLQTFSATLFLSVILLLLISANIQGPVFWYILSGAQISFNLFLLLSVVVSRVMYAYRKSKSIPSKLPTVTVCIPARNETQDLPDCIESVLVSNYHKLEILVLDDCSHDKTPEIIKGYAHAGVRFIPGKEPSNDWLAKNAAYDRLADEARGDIILYLGVDIRLEPDSITELVGQLQDADMISILPKRSKSVESSFFVQPIRYWWELGLWRFLFSSPPVLSSCWAIRSDVLKAHGGFDSMRKAVSPEALWAKKTMKDKKYAFLIANNSVGITSNKPPKDQMQTALRIRYPQLKRRIEIVYAVILSEAVFMFLPFIMAISALIVRDDVLFIGSLISSVSLIIANTIVYSLALKKMWFAGIFTVPALIVADWWLLIKSMYAYEFGKVIWKERNICIPLLKVEKSLPKLKD